MPDLARARTFLFVPADRPERIGKALGAGADAVVVDLEDAVAEDAKRTAREGLAEALDPERPVVLRVNAADTEWHADDLALLEHPGICAVMLPKAEDLAVVDALPCPVIPLIETARGLHAAEALAQANGLVRLAFGTIDFMLDMDLPGEGEAMSVYRARLALASKVAGIASPIDGVTSEITDEARIAEETHRALAFGFGARLCIHPKQVPVIHTAMRPSEKEAEWARRVTAAADAAGGGAVQLDGRMIDRPVVERARKLLTRL